VAPFDLGIRSKVINLEQPAAAKVCVIPSVLLASHKPPDHSRPTCPDCGNAMWLTMAETSKARLETRTFRCQVCRAKQTRVTEYKTAQPQQ
jgi:DNA-directed RNA polymerase subunit M/transcription elongation factor TFIIS